MAHAKRDGKIPVTSQPRIVARRTTTLRCTRVLGLRWSMKMEMDHFTKANERRRNGMLAYSPWSASALLRRRWSTTHL